MQASFTPVVSGKEIGNLRYDLIARYAKAWDSTKSPLIPKSSINFNLLERIRKKINAKIESIDKLGIDGDFVESQAFAYLATRSYLKLPISFPETTGCKKPCIGGILV